MQSCQYSMVSYNMVSFLSITLNTLSRERKVWGGFVSVTHWPLTNLNEIVEKYFLNKFL